MASRNFTLFHLSLIQPRQVDLEEVKATREEWLRKILADEFKFEYRAGGYMHWVPKDDVDECIFGLLERKRPHEHHEPPERGGGEVITDEWQGAYVLIDPTHHEDGQKVAIENDVVGKPSSLLANLMNAVNKRHDKPYQIEFEPIFDSNTFWQFADKHDSVLSNITFDFVVPNMWGAKNGLDKDLRETGAQTGTERVKIGLSSKSGVYTDNQKVADGVEYAERGAGTIKARSFDGTTYTSENSVKTTKVPSVKDENESMHGFFKKLKRRILGREKNDAAPSNDIADSNSSDD